MIENNPTLLKLNSLAKFLYRSGSFSFKNYNLKLFYQFLITDPEISIIIKTLLSRYPSFQENIKAIQDEFNRSKCMNIRLGINTFDEFVAFCISCIAFEIENNGKLGLINNFLEKASSEQDSDERDKKKFYEECIDPIILYIELQVKESLHALYVLQRYKILCEWYDKELFNTYKDEVDITKNHLSKFLFNSGFTYSLFETNSPSGRIDNFGINFKEFTNLPSVIICEGKIYKNMSSITAVYNQVNKRVKEFNINEGYCVIYNKTTKNLQFNNSSGLVNSINYIDSKVSRIYFLVVDLFHEKSTITEINEPIDLSLLGIEKLK